MTVFSKRKSGVFLCVFLMLLGKDIFCQTPYEVQVSYEEAMTPDMPNYNTPENWSALPQKKDMADSLPIGINLVDGQISAMGDVFFIYPTIFTSQPKNEFQWNADVKDSVLNAYIDNLAILNQSTAFNGSCRVYAPRYRQAHYSAFTSPDSVSASKALNLAYEDVKRAFEYYLENYNKGRPIIIAAHSQGTVHAVTLLKEYFDGKELHNQLVQAYLIGMPIKRDEFREIKVSESPEEIGGFVSWNTFLKGFYPEYYNNGLNKAVCTNPLTWQTNDTYANKELNSGGIGLKFSFIEGLADAQVNKGLLWISKPYVKGRLFIKTKIWHRADINLYWMNIRENVALRLAQFRKENPNYGE